MSKKKLTHHFQFECIKTDIFFVPPVLFFISLFWGSGLRKLHELKVLMSRNTNAL